METDGNDGDKKYECCNGEIHPENSNCDENVM